jgi:arginase
MSIDPKKVLRLNVPQWQGGDRPDYRLGARVLAAIASEPLGPVETIPIPRPVEGPRTAEAGIVSRTALLDQLHAARSAILKHKPDAIVTLGGDCLVDLAPIAYLSERYGDDLAVLWVDAHPDVMSPAQWQNAHAHVLAMLMGEGDPDFVAAVSRPLDPRRILYVGLTETNPFETSFIKKHQLAQIGPEELATSSQPVLAWLRATTAKQVAVHFDVDVLSPAHYDFLIFRNPSAPPDELQGVARGRMKFARVAEILNAVGAEAEIVGLAIAEYLPWTVIEFAAALNTLPLLRISEEA